MKTKRRFEFPWTWISQPRHNFIKSCDKIESETRFKKRLQLLTNFCYNSLCNQVYKLFIVKISVHVLNCLSIR